MTKAEDKGSDQDIIILEAKALRDASFCTLDENLRTHLANRVLKLLSPLAENNHPEAQFILWQMNLKDSGNPSVNDLDKNERYCYYLRKCAQAGDIASKFYLGLELETNPATIEEGRKLIKEAAEQEYPEAMWLHGNYVWAGTGQKANEKAGIDFIIRAAEKKYELAIVFLARAYTDGNHGFKKDPAEASRWWRVLYDSDVIPE